MQLTAPGNAVPVRLPTKLLRIMRLTASLLLIASLHLSATSLAQKVSVSGKEIALEKLMTIIRKQTGYTFFYNDKDIKGIKVDVVVKDASIETTLQQAFSHQPFTYKIQGNTIALSKKLPEPAPAPPPAVTAIIAEIKGQILNNKKEPIVGATILDRTQSKATKTDEKGFFTLHNINTNDIFEISAIGYYSQLIAIRDDHFLAFTMEVNVEKLDEATVTVGYGQQKKSLLVSSVSTVTGTELAVSPTGNVTQSLAGRLPGLTAYSQTGLGGADDATLLIRGRSTTGDNTPLIVIDGIPRSNFISAQTSGNTLLEINPLSYLNVNDIETISILKDAAATSVYGARAANGVILVTTKKGSSGAPTITYNGNVGIQQSNFINKPLSSYQIAQMWNQAWQNEGTFAPTYGGAKGFNDSALNAIKNGTDPNRFSNTDWNHIIFGKTVMQNNHNLSISGGTDRTRYFISGGFFDQDGLYSAAGSKRYNIRSNLDGRIGNNISFSLSLAGRHESDRVGLSVPSAFFISPLEPIRYTNGTYLYDPSYGNPYLTSRGVSGYDNDTKDYFESSGYLTYNIPHVEGLSVKGLLSYDKYFIFNKVYNVPLRAYVLNDDNSYTYPATLSGLKPQLIENYTQYQTLTEEASVNYAHGFGSHNISALLLYTQTQNEGDNLSATRVNFPSSILDQLAVGSPTNETNNGTGLKNARRGIVGRTGYDFRHKYIAEFDFRYDGSDLFPTGHRYGFFPAAAAGWRLSEESFIKDNLHFINNLKLRGSWGQAGNDRAGQFQYLNTYAVSTSQGYSFGGTTAVAGSVLQPGPIANPIFTWEKATTTDLGLEAGLWKDKLSLTVDVFKKRTSNILADLSTQIPSLIGGTVGVQNYGIVDNKGIDLQLTHQLTVGAVHYFVTANLTFNRSNVVKYPEPQGVTPQLRIEGKRVSPDAVTGYKAEGLYQSDQEIANGPTPLLTGVKPGDIKYADINHDGKITSADLVIVSKGITPGLVYGLNTGLSYKGFDMNAFFQGAADAQIYLPLQSSYSFYNSTKMAFAFQSNYWTPTNTSANFPRPTVTSKNNQQSSSFWLRNGAYLRLKTAEMGYTLPGTLLKSIGLKETRFYVNGSNLLTFSHVKGITDPESRVGAYPLLKVYNFGATIKF